MFFLFVIVSQRVNLETKGECKNSPFNNGRNYKWENTLQKDKDTN